MEAVAVDWSRLPEDLLLSVMGALEVTDLVRSGTVCTSWRSCYSTFRRLCLRSMQPSPWLLYSSEADDPDTATIYNLGTKSSLCVRLPEPSFCSRAVVGSAYGWLVTADKEESNLHFVNPLTGCQMALPPVWGLYNVKRIWDEQGNLRYIVDEFPGDPDPLIFTADDVRDRMFDRIVFSCSPSAGSECIILLLHYPGGQISFARLGDDRWTRVSGTESLEREDDYEHAVYNKNDGLFYVLNFDASIYTLDLNGPSPIAMMIIPGILTWVDPFKYLVFAPWGDLLMVWRYINASESTTTVQLPTMHGGHEITYTYHIYTEQIKLFKVDYDNQKLVKMTSLGDHALFIGYNCTLCLPIKDFPMFKPDCVYFTDDYGENMYCNKYQRRDIGIWDLNSRNLQSLCNAPPFRPWLNWPAPVWITPSLD